MDIHITVSFCQDCIAGLHTICLALRGDDNCCCIEKGAPVESESVGGRLKDAAVMKDPLSTGRKRAAVLYPMAEGDICEWSLLKFAGGGVRPIIGCTGNPAVARHHGPDKDIINNSVGNVHRICVHCHNRWHTLNDQYYGTRPTPGTPFLPIEGGTVKEHDSETVATDVERLENEVYWNSNPANRAGED